jgi:hypothetical protein
VVAACGPGVQKRRRRKATADINVALYIKQQQLRGSSRKWRQEWWVPVRLAFPARAQAQYQLPCAAAVAVLVYAEHAARQRLQDTEATGHIRNLPGQACMPVLQLC